MKEFDLLKNEVVFIVFIYKDNSKRIYCSTLNRELMKSLNREFKLNYIYDILKDRYYPLADIENIREVNICSNDLSLTTLEKYINDFI